MIRGVGPRAGLLLPSIAIYGWLGTSAVHAEFPLLDAWQGFKDQAAQAGVTPSITYEGDAADNASGGVRRGATYSANLHVRLALDGDMMIGVPGLSALLDGLWISGGNASKLVGDAQGVSSIAAPLAVLLYEAWVQYNSPDGRWSVLAGRYDLNTEFYRLTSADLFLNSSFGIGPEFDKSGFAGPSTFPDPSVGVRLGYKPGANSVLRGAILDAAPIDRLNGSPAPFNTSNGLLLVGEAAFLTRPTQPDSPSDHGLRIGRHLQLAPYDDKIAFGGWCYTSSFSEPEPVGVAGSAVPHRGEAGAYFLLDRTLVKAADDPKRRLTAFLQLGVADQPVDRFTRYIGVGLVAGGILPGRPDDQLGVAAAMARNSSRYILVEEQSDLPVAAAETAVELTYLAPIGSFLGLQPDVQYVIHPNTDPRIRNATVLQLRFEATF